MLNAVRKSRIFVFMFFYLTIDFGKQNGFDSNKNGSLKKTVSTYAYNKIPFHGDFLVPNVSVLHVSF